jgi:hypothetical protein
MEILASMMNSVSCYCGDAAATGDDAGFENTAACLMSKIRTVEPSHGRMIVLGALHLDQ